MRREKKGTSPLWSSPKNPSCQSEDEKGISKTQIEGHSTKCPTGMPQNCQGHQKQGKSETLSQTRSGEGAVTTNCNVMGSWKRKKMSGGKVMKLKVWHLGNSSVPVLVPLL